MTEKSEEQRVAEVLAPHLNEINEAPELLSILYDAGMMPEQARTVRDAIAIAAVVVAWKAGMERGAKDAYMISVNVLKA